MGFSTTMDQGRLHVASGNQYQGSINTYNNFVTRLSSFAGLSSYVTIDGKAHCVNNKSYINFLHALGVQNASMNNLSDYRNLDTVNVTLLKNKGPMNAYLTPSKTNKLARELIYAIECGGVLKAKKLLSQGANPNRVFWSRDQGWRFSFENYNSEYLPKRTLKPFTIACYTPILFAASKSQNVLVEDLKSYNADVNFRGKRFEFSRVMMDYCPYHHIVTLEDSTTKHQTISLDVSKNQLEFTDTDTDPTFPPTNHLWKTKRYVAF